MNSNFVINLNHKQYGFYLRNDAGDFLLRSPEKGYASLAQICQDIERIRFCAQNLNAYQIKIAGSGSYKFLLMDPYDQQSLGKCGPFDSALEAKLGIESFRRSVQNAEVVFEDPYNLGLRPQDLGSSSSSIFPSSF